jgi:4'-phosphopantetheinyl transferase
VAASARPPSTRGTGFPDSLDLLIRWPEVVRVEHGVVQVHWFATDLPAARLDQLAPLLADGERARAERFRLPRDRNRYVAARGQLRILLAGCLGQAPAAVVIEAGRDGKPELQPVPGSERIQFNLSHSEGVGVLAIGIDDELGIDVEHIRPMPDASGIAERVFAAGEIRALRAVADEARAEAFLRYWTRKEAVVKSLGRGLSHPLDGFELSPDGLEPERVLFPGAGPSAARWVLPLTPPYPGFVAALATAGALPQIRSSCASR